MGCGGPDDAGFVAAGDDPEAAVLDGGVIERDPKGFILTGTDLLKDGKPPKTWNIDRSYNGVDLLSGQIQVQFDPTTLPHIAAGRLKCFAVLGEKRWPGKPDVPTLTGVSTPAVAP